MLYRRRGLSVSRAIWSFSWRTSAWEKRWTDMVVAVGCRASAWCVRATLDPDTTEVSRPRILLSSPLVQRHRLGVYRALGGFGTYLKSNIIFFSINFSDILYSELFWLWRSFRLHSLRNDYFGYSSNQVDFGHQTFSCYGPFHGTIVQTALCQGSWLSNFSNLVSFGFFPPHTAGDLRACTYCRKIALSYAHSADSSSIGEDLSALSDSPCSVCVLEPTEPRTPVGGRKASRNIFLEEDLAWQRWNTERIRKGEGHKTYHCTPLFLLTLPYPSGVSLLCFNSAFLPWSLLSLFISFTWGLTLTVPSSQVAVWWFRIFLLFLI